MFGWHVRRTREGVLSRIRLVGFLMMTCLILDWCRVVVFLRAVVIIVLDIATRTLWMVSVT